MEQIPGYDEQITYRKEQKPKYYCTSCGIEIYEGDYLYAIKGERLCENCLNDQYRETA